MHLNMDELRELQAQHLVNLIPDPHSELMLANYTPQAQYGKEWDNHPVLLQCRGVILSPDGYVWAMPFSKFFNLGERPGTAIEDLADLGTPEIAHKMDGSMITLFRDPYTNAVRFASRGSFTSDQAQAAARIWQARYSHLDSELDGDYTHVFELIAPYNRIVVAYEQEELVLTGLVDVVGSFAYEMRYAVVRAHALRLGLTGVVTEEALDWRTLHALERGNFEGFVLYWPERSFRLKVKLAEYVRLHRIITGLNEHTIWEMCRDQADLEAVRRDLPEELLPWFNGVANGLAARFMGHYSAVDTCAIHLRSHPSRGTKREQRKDAAAYINACVPSGLRAACFLALDSRDPSPAIWRLLEPRNATVTEVAARSLAS